MGIRQERMEAMIKVAQESVDTLRNGKRMIDLILEGHKESLKEAIMQVPPEHREATRPVVERALILIAVIAEHIDNFEVPYKTILKLEEEKILFKINSKRNLKNRAAMRRKRMMERNEREEYETEMEDEFGNKPSPLSELTQEQIAEVDADIRAELAKQELLDSADQTEALHKSQ